VNAEGVGMGRGYSVLEFASSSGHIAMTEWLLDEAVEAKSARWERRDMNSLHVAAALGQRAMVELLVRRGVYDVNARTAAENGGGNTALHFVSEAKERDIQLLAKQRTELMKSVKNPPQSMVKDYDPLGVVEVLVGIGGADPSIQSGCWSSNYCHTSAAPPT